MHAVEPLGLRVVRLHLLVGDRPGGRHAAVVPHLGEVLSAHAYQGRAVELRVPTDEVVRPGMELPPVTVEPGLVRVVAVLDDDGVRVPVLLLARHPAAALEEEDALPRRREAVGQGPPPAPVPMMMTS
jgi:hypothetical protein